MSLENQNPQQNQPEKAIGRKPETLRLFIALRFSEEAEKRLVDIQKKWKEQNIAGRYSKPENLHITAAFLGEQKKEDLPKIEQALRSVLLPDISLHISGSGHFGNLWFARIADNPLLAEYVKAVRSALKQAGIHFDAKAFKGHITLVRKAQIPAGEEPSLQGFETPLQDVCLMASELKKDGPIYTPLLEIRPEKPA